MVEEQNANRLGTQIDFRTILAGAKTYGDIQEAIRQAVVETKEKGVEKVGFVSGSVANIPKNIMGEARRELIGKNMERLRTHTANLREKHMFPIFSSADIFDAAWKELIETNLTPEVRASKMRELFRGILRNGITDIFMTPGWDRSAGAVDEFKTATEIDITIHHVEPLLLQ